jgi:hypothetical protein
MKIKMVRVAVALLVIGTMLSASRVYAQSKEKAKPAKKQAAGKQETTPNMEEMMAVYAKYAEPGEFHKHLQPLVGSWNASVKWWMAPGAPANEAKSTEEVKWILDGRFLQQEVRGEMMGKPFMGLGLIGYDNYKKKYVGAWIDSMSTMIWNSQGTCDATGKVITLAGEFDDPATGKKKKARGVTRIIDDNNHIMEWYESGPDGKEFKSMEITYTRK